MFDFHTHNLQLPPGTGIVSLPQDAILHPQHWLDTTHHLPHAAEGALYAAGIHPWWTAQPNFDLQTHLKGLQQLLQLPEVVQLGECGIDTLQGDSPNRQPAPIEQQLQALQAQITIAEAHAIPLTIHCVRAFDHILRLHRQAHTSRPWTIHAFRGKPALAQQLTAAGLHLSFGKHHNPQAYAITPPEQRHNETDETPPTQTTTIHHPKQQNK